MLRLDLTKFMFLVQQLQYTNTGISLSLQTAEVRADPNYLIFLDDGLVTVLNELVVMLESMGMNVSLIATNRVLKVISLANQVKYFYDGITRPAFKASEIDGLVHQIGDIVSKVKDELHAKCFVVLPGDLRAYYEPERPLFGEDVFNAFPSACDDIAEAGKCLALGRSTASVFHLMRVMEVGLKAMSKEFAIPYAPSWESYLKQMNDTLSEKWTALTPQQKKDAPFYKELVGDLTSIKLAWRNPTMHVVRKFTTEEALNIFTATRQFMRRLALKPMAE